MRKLFITSAVALAATATSFAQTATMGPQTAAYNGSTRGYYFTAPMDFTITGVQVLNQTGSGNTVQNFSIVRYDGAVPPPNYATTTNAFTTLALGLDLNQAVFEPVNAQVSTGDVIGVYGNTMAAVGGTTGQNSYAGLAQQTTMIGGMSVDLFRSGMQFHLGSATSPLGMHDTWAEAASFNITRVEFTYVPGHVGGTLGTSYCGPGIPNSTGNSGVISAAGSAVAADNDVTLTASDLPTNAFGFFLTSQVQGLVGQPGGSLGVLCLGGSIGRYVGAGQIQNTGNTGEMSLVLDLTQTPQPNGLVAVMAGETWNFQGWHRDAVGGLAVSNFTDAVSIPFM